MCPDPSSLTFEVEVADEDVTRAASSADAPWPARLSSVDGKADDLQMSCRVLDGIVRPDVDSVAVTRGSLVSSLSSFGVSAAVYPAASTYSAQPCGSLFFAQQVTAGAPTGWFWPGSGKEAAFYAYYPYGSSCFTLSSTAAAVGVPVYSYTVPSSVASQPDIMTAQVTDVAGDTGGSVALPFRHRCAALRFSLTNDSSDDIVIDSVIVEGVASSGTLQGDTWTPGATTGKFYLAPASGITVIAGNTVDLAGTSGIFFMIPQMLPSGAKLRIVTSEDSFEAELSGSWIAGKTYGYEITKTAADYIDLGLPSGTLWAKGNICKDASGNYYIGEPYDNGAYFQWGGTVGYNAAEEYSSGSHPTNVNITPESGFDSARETLGNPWRMFTANEGQELIDNTDQERTTINGVDGFKFMMKTNHDIFIFLPRAYKISGNYLATDAGGRYWTTDISSQRTDMSMYLYLAGTWAGIRNNDYFIMGYTIRAVRSPETTISVKDGSGDAITDALLAVTYPDGSVQNVRSDEQGKAVIYAANGGYTVKSGLYTFTSSSFTISGDTEVNLTGSRRANGVYAYYEDGSIRDYASADASAIGVAVIADDCQYVVDKTNVSNSMSFGGNNVNMQDISAYSQDDCLNDLTGYSNTEKIIDRVGASNAPAAANCKSRFGGAGYLGSMGEMYQIWPQKTNIDNMLVKIGGSAMDAQSYWTSTMPNDNTNAYRMNYMDGVYLTRGRSQTFYVRALMKL